MPERTLTVGPAEGLHARPAARFVKAAKGFTSDITVAKGERSANAKSQLKVMQLAAKQGERVVLHAEGDDADAALDALEPLVTSADD